MSRVIGIDLRDNHVRIAALNVGYRRLELAGFYEELTSIHETSVEAVRACLAQIDEGGFDSAIVSVDGAKCFTHKVTLPASAKKRLADLLPFELEALLPLEIDELTVDHTLLSTTGEGESGELSVLAVAARLEHVEQMIELVREASDKQPERVGVSTTELEQLSHLNPGMRGEEPIALIDLGFTRTDLCILKNGKLQQARALSLGVEGFPDRATECVSRIRQTLAAHAAATSQEVSRIYILGDGAGLSGITEYLSGQLGVTVETFDQLELEGVTPEIQPRVPMFGRALATAMHGVRGKGLDLRQGDLSFERGYEHVKERAPLLAGLMSAVLLSFFFSIWAESRALAAENEALLTSLHEITQSTFGTGTDDPDEAEMELEKARKSRPEDPMPYLDGFGVAVVISESVPDDLTHDIEELDVAKGKVKIRGLVESAKDAQTVAKKFGEHRCIHEPNVTKITQVVGTEKQRYTMEAELYCPEDEGAAKKSKKKKKGESK